MADSETNNLGLIKPEIEGSPDTWGEKINEDLDVIDDYATINRMALQTALQTGASSGALSDIKSENPVNLTEEQFRVAVQPLFYSEAVVIDPLDPLTLVTQIWVKKLIDIVFPIGTIMLWGMPVGTAIPAGWTICNGIGVINNAGVLVTPPNMMGRFVLGSSGNYGNYQPGSTAGTAYDFAHIHDVVIDNYALLKTQIPGHTHEGTGNNGTGALVGRSSNGTYTVPGQAAGAFAQVSLTNGNVGANGIGGAAAGHNHTASTLGNTEPPPLISLIYIMKIDQWGYVKPA